MSKQSKDWNITGNPGTNNSFQQIDVQHADTVAPRAETVRNTYYYGTEGKFVPLHITKVINVLANTKREEDEDDENDYVTPDIERKIEFNDLEKWSEIIHEFGFWNADVESIYIQFDKQARSKRAAVFNWLRYELYFSLRKDFSGDELFDKIYDKVVFLVKNDPEYEEDMGLELMSENIMIVLVHAFMACKIFKKPKPV